MEKQIEELKAKMERSSQALVGFERELNVINPEEKTNILVGSPAATEYGVHQCAGAIGCKKEAAYESVKGGSMEAALAAAQGEGLRRLVEHLNDAREHFAEVKTHYGANHPEYQEGGGEGARSGSGGRGDDQGCRAAGRDRISARASGARRW